VLNRHADMLDHFAAGLAGEARQEMIGRWCGHMRDRETSAIGCQTAPLGSDLDAWITRLAEEHRATPMEVAAARAFVAMCQAMMEADDD